MRAKLEIFLLVLHPEACQAHFNAHGKGTLIVTISLFYLQFRATQPHDQGSGQFRQAAMLTG
jgi:hypothetical protein